VGRGRERGEERKGEAKRVYTNAEIIKVYGVSVHERGLGVVRVVRAVLEVVRERRGRVVVLVNVCYVPPTAHTLT
jgi:hypothetical protein